MNNLQSQRDGEIQQSISFRNVTVILKKKKELKAEVLK
jgi:hypothetical protein